MFVAKWQDQGTYACYSNTINGAIHCLLNFVPNNEAGVIYVYNYDKLVEKMQNFES